MTLMTAISRGGSERMSPGGIPSGNRTKFGALQVLRRVAVDDRNQLTNFTYR